jgi:CO/xanthine dehydrogenase FAD-binding subunit
MSTFDYARAKTIEHALELLADPSHHSRVLAGGTDVMVLVRHQAPAYTRVVDITKIAALKVIERRGDEIAIGAGVTFTEAAESALLQAVAPGLVEACLTVGGPAIRNAGTLGGNVMNAAAAADAAPFLVCLDGRGHLASGAGLRAMSVTELMAGAKGTSLRPDELLTHFTFVPPLSGARQAFAKLGRRNAQAISRLSMAAIGRLDAQGRVDFVRLAPGAALPSPRRCTPAEELLLGQIPGAELLAEAGNQTAAWMIGVTGRRWSTEYKEVAIQGLVERTLGRVFSA